jgi:hypothetical protein
MRRVDGVTFLLLTCLACATNPEIAETIVYGRVVDYQSGSPLPSASVLVAGTNIGTITDSTGVFKVRLPAGQDSATLVYQSIGYEMARVTVALGERERVRVGDQRLRIQSIPLDDLIVPACQRVAAPPPDTAGVSIRQITDSTGIYWLVCPKPKKLQRRSPAAPSTGA